MVRLPTNEEIESHLKDSKETKNLSLKSRESFDKNPFAHLETIYFNERKNPYILKSVVPFQKSEIYIHQQVNDFDLNGAHLIYGHTEDSNLNYLIMEKIEDIKPIYLISNNDAESYYCQVAEYLADFHLKSKSTKFTKKLIKLGVPIHGTKWYQDYAVTISDNVKTLSKEINHEYFLPIALVNNLQDSIHSIQKMFEPFKKAKLTLVHGDFDIGNLFLKDSDTKIFAIDYGMSHIDNPMIDIAHLVNSLGDYDIGIRRNIFSAYFTKARKLYPKDISMHETRIVGTLMHILYFLNFQINAINNWVDKEYSLFLVEQVHNRVKHLVDLLS